MNGMYLGDTCCSYLEPRALVLDLTLILMLVLVLMLIQVWQMEHGMPSADTMEPELVAETAGPGTCRDTVPMMGNRKPDISHVSACLGVCRPCPRNESLSVASPHCS